MKGVFRVKVKKQNPSKSLGYYNDVILIGFISNFVYEVITNTKCQGQNFRAVS